jgi:cell division protein FtsA
MAKQNFIAALDIGSGKIRCLIGAPDGSGRVKVLGGATVSCQGVKGGVVANIEETARAIATCVEFAEAEAKATISGVLLGVRGAHIQSLNNRGAFNIARSDKEVTVADVQSVISNAKAVGLSSDREILHVVPQGFSLDRQRGVPNPVGMEGSLLEVDVHLVTASTNQLNNVLKSVGKAGFAVIEPIYSLLAVGEQLVTPEERDLGTLLIDFGGQSTSLGIYSEGSLRYSKELPIGSDDITRDLAFGLETSLLTAERVKIEHGFAHPSLLKEDYDIEFTGIDGRTPARIKAKALMDLLLPRVEDIFTVIGDTLEASSFRNAIGPGGVILTGGGSLMRGTAQAAAQLLEMKARIGVAHPDKVSADEKWLTPGYATALGLLTFSSQSHWGTGAAQKTGLLIPSWLRKTISGLEDLFR